jgi:hypothetical protein
MAILAMGTPGYTAPASDINTTLWEERADILQEMGASTTMASFSHLQRASGTSMQNPLGNETDAAMADMLRISNETFTRFFASAKDMVKSLVTDDSMGEALWQALLNDISNPDFTPVTRRQTMNSGHDYSPIWPYYDRTANMCGKLQRVNDASVYLQDTLGWAMQSPDETMLMLVGPLLGYNMFASTMSTLSHVVQERLLLEGRICILTDHHPSKDQLQPSVDAFVSRTTERINSATPKPFDMKAFQRRIGMSSAPRAGGRLATAVAAGAALASMILLH